MKKQLTNLLQNANLRNEEVKIYLLLLKLRASTISELIEKSGLGTMMVYRTLKRLNERGIVQEKKLNQKQNLYHPLSLKSLIEKLSREQRRLAKLQNSLKNLDSLLPYVDIDNEADDQFIELKEGLESFLEEYLKIPDICEREFLHIGSMENFWKTARLSYDAPEERNFIHRRMGKGVFARIVDIQTPHMKYIQKMDSLEKRSSRLSEELPVHKNYLTIAEKQANLFVCDPENPRVVIIREPELLKLQKEQFSSLWEKSC